LNQSLKHSSMRKK